MVRTDAGEPLSPEAVIPAPQEVHDVRASKGTAAPRSWTGCGNDPVVGAAGRARAQESDAAALDALLAPIALYPDALLAQVLTASTSPDQVKEFNTWLKEQTSTGSELQQAATDAGYDASFASLALFPEVVSTLASNTDWTKEVGTAYLSKPEDVMASIQRLRDKAHDAGNLKTNEQQTVTVEGSGSSQTIVVQPTNPQVVYVPTYDPQTAYAPPPPQSSGNTAMAAIIGFAAGIAIGAAIDDDPYYYGPHGWGAWGMGWGGGGAVVYGGSAWVVPRGRYPYVRPVPAYRPNRTVVAPRRTNVNVNVNRNKVNVGNQVNVGNTNVGSGNKNRGSQAKANQNRANQNVSKGSVDRSPNAGDRASTTSKAKSTTAKSKTTSSSATHARAPERGHAAPAKATAPKKAEKHDGDGRVSGTDRARRRTATGASRRCRRARARARSVPRDTMTSVSRGGLICDTRHGAGPRSWQAPSRWHRVPGRSEPTAQTRVRHA